MHVIHEICNILHNTVKKQMLFMCILKEEYVAKSKEIKDGVVIGSK
jgi:hypothetical protein